MRVSAIMTAGLLLSACALGASRGATPRPAVAAPPPPPQPCSASALVTEHANWLGQGKQNVVRVTAVSNQRNRLASYAEGTLAVTGSPFPKGPGGAGGGPTILGGTLKQYFSDRAHSTATKGGVYADSHPFSPSKTDSLGLSLTTAGAVTLTLKSWGGTNLKLSGVDCAGGVLYGMTETSVPSFYVISPSKEKAANAVIK